MGGSDEDAPAKVVEKASLSGTVKLFDGREWIDSHPGDFVYVPEGGLHGFRNESGEPASPGPATEPPD